MTLRKRLHPLLVSMFVVALAIPALATEHDADSHVRPTLSEAEETDWLNTLVANSPHRIALQTAKATVGQLPPVTLTPPPATTSWTMAGGGQKALPAKKGPRNYGFLPYWTIKNTKLHWDSLTQLAWFSAEVSSTGTIGNTHGWGGSTAKAIIAEAHKHGVQVTLTFTLFSKAGITNVLATASKRKTLVNKIVTMVIDGGGDGVNIDFEGLAKESRDQMKAFIALLTKEMHAKLPGSDVTLATPAVDWSGAWDYDYLAENSNGLFVMAYGVHWKGSNPGAQLPMAKDPPWVHKTLQWIVDDYFKYGKAINKHKFIIGLPLYGNTWPASSSLPGAKKLSNGKAVTYENAKAEAPKKGGWKWDKASQSSYYTWKISGGWQQTWVDDLQAFKMRTAYLKKRDVHMGLWALGYADKDTGVWADIQKFVGGTTGGTTGGSSSGGSSSGGQDAGPTDTQADGGASDSGVPGNGGKDSGQVDAGPDTADTTADAGTPKDAAGSSGGNNDSGSSATDDTAGVDGINGTGKPDGNGKPDAATQDSATTGKDSATTDEDGAAENQDVGQAGESDVGAGKDSEKTEDSASKSDSVAAQDAATGLAPVSRGVPSTTGGCQAVTPGSGPLPMMVMFVMMVMGIVSRKNPWQ